MPRGIAAGFMFELKITMRSALGLTKMEINRVLAFKSIGPSSTAILPLGTQDTTATLDRRSTGTPNQTRPLCPFLLASGICLLEHRLALCRSLQKKIRVDLP